MKTDFPTDAPLSPEELAAYAIDTPEAVAVAAATEPAAAPAADAPLTPEELAGYEDAPLEAAPVAVATADTAPRRVNMVGGQGELVDVAPEDVERVYGLGYRLDPSEAAGLKTVALLERDGVRMYDGADPEVQARLSAGSMIATPAEIAAEYGDAGSTTAAAAEGLAQGATLGAYGLAADALGGADYRAERMAREAASPYVSTGANLVGAIAPALLSGGSSASATGAGLAARAAALTPAARLASLGGRLAESLTAQATARGLGAGGRIAASALAAGAEGAVDNAVRVVADDLAAGDVDITAERMSEAMWDGAKWSAILGGAAGAVGEVAGRLRGRASQVADEAPPTLDPDPLPMQDVPPPEAVRPRVDIDADLDAARQRVNDAERLGDDMATAEAEDALQQAMAEQEAAVMASQGLTPDAAIADTLAVEPPPEVLGILDRIDRNLNTSKNAAELRVKLKDEANGLATSITTDLDDLSRFGTNTFDTYTNRSNKPKVIRAMLEQDGVQWSDEAADRILKRVAQMEQTLEEMGSIKEHAIYKDVQLKSFKAGREGLGKVREHLTGMRAPTQGPMAPNARVITGTIDDVAKTYHGLDLFKSHLGSFAAQMGGRPATASEATFQRLYMLLRADLQDARIFGPALAEMQTVTNAAITRNIRKSRLFNDAFGRAGSSESGGQFGFADVLEHDPKRIGAMVDDLANPRAYKDTRDFFAGLTSRVELMETLSKYYPMPAAAKAQIAAARETLERVKVKMRGAKEIALRSAEADRLAASTNNFQEILNGVRALPLGGIAALPGAVAQFARGLSASMVALGKGAAKQERAVERAARDTVRHVIDSTPPPKKPKLTGAAKDVPPHLGGLGITANELRRAVEDAQAMEDPLSDQSRALEAQLEDVAVDSPELAAALRAKAQENAAFIASKVGPVVDTSDPFGARPSLVDPVTERSVARYVDAARYPAKAFARLSQGQGTKEDRETLQALYPRQYERYVERVVAQAQKLKRPTPAQRQRLHLATGVPMSREQQPEYIARRQAEYAAGQEAQAETPSTSPALEPMVKPSNANTEFHADRRFASRSDEIMGGADD